MVANESPIASGWQWEFPVSFRSLELHLHLLLLSHRFILNLVLSRFPNIYHNVPQCLHIQQVGTGRCAGKRDGQDPFLIDSLCFRF